MQTVSSLARAFVLRSDAIVLFRATGNVNFYFLCGHGTCDETHWSTIAANLARCHEVHGTHDSDGLRADLVVDAKEGAAAQLPVLIERPPPCPAAPKAPSIARPHFTRALRLSAATVRTAATRSCS